MRSATWNGFLLTASVNVSLKATGPQMSGFMKQSSWRCQNIVHQFHVYAAHRANLELQDRRTRSWAKSWGNTERRTCWLRFQLQEKQRQKCWWVRCASRSCRSFLFTEAPRAQRSNTPVEASWSCGLECSEFLNCNYSWLFRLMFSFIRDKRLFSAEKKKKNRFSFLLEDGSVLTGWWEHLIFFYTRKQYKYQGFLPGRQNWF